ncbi:MAG: hypothetical protein V1778_03935 [bacterium]
MQQRNPFPLFPSASESLRLVSYCPMCSTHYNPLTAEILEEREDAHLIHIECRKCGSSIVGLVLTGGLGISSVSLVTDLTGEEVLRFRKSEAIESDDVLAAHQVLFGPERNFLDELDRSP